MQLDYKVLFVDDEGFKVFMGELKDSIESYLADMGFILNATEVNTKEGLEKQLSSDKDYDMIFVDNKFDDQDCGIEFIKKIRAENIYADIVLCTARPDDELIKKFNAETAHNGFYYFKKGTDLIQHTFNIIDFRFSKELDINVMRGIAMSEVANFDNRILEILLKDTDSYKHGILSMIKEKTESRYNEVINPEVQDDIWKNVINPDKSTMYFESSMRKDFLHNNVLNDIDSLKDCYKAIKSRYSVDILQKRNKLAHQISPKLSNDDIKQFRKDLITFRGIFDKVTKYFNDQSQVKE